MGLKDLLANFKPINVAAKLADHFSLTNIKKAAQSGLINININQNTYNYNIPTAEAEKLREMEPTPELEEKYEQDLGKRLASNATALKALSEQDFVNAIASTSATSAACVVAPYARDKVSLHDSVKVKIGDPYTGDSSIGEADIMTTPSTGLPKKNGWNWGGGSDEGEGM